MSKLKPTYSPTRISGSTSSAAAGSSGEAAEGAVPQLGLAQAILQETLERVLGGIRPAAIAIGDATDSDAVEAGVGLVGRIAEGAARQDRGCRQSGRAAEKCSPGCSVVDGVLRHVPLLKMV